MLSIDKMKEYFLKIEEILLDKQAETRLNEMAKEMARAGASQDEVYRLFDSFRSGLCNAGREKEEDLIMNVMDNITGWCGSHNKIFPE